MGPVRQNPIQRTVSLFICVCFALCTIVAHNIAQNRPDSFPPYPPRAGRKLSGKELTLTQFHWENGGQTKVVAVVFRC